jgi:surface polysaccharide O-acyltransferase-like enzyme
MAISQRALDTEVPSFLSGAPDQRPSTASLAVSTEATRILWLDALKVCSILGVIGIHVTADSAGFPYAAHPAAERLAPALARALATSFSYPILLVLSFFLLAPKAADPATPYTDVVGARMRRLIPPFLIWSAFYLVFRNLKAYAFGYHDYYLEELLLPGSWLKYLLIGGAQYHLHFLPTLIMLTLLYPVYKLALRWPAFGLALFATLFAWPALDAYVYTVLSPSHEMLPIVLSMTKVLGFTGYGLLGFSLYAIWDRGPSRVAVAFLAFLAFGAAIASGVALFHEAHETAEAGRWLDRDLLTHFAHYVAPASVVVVAFTFTHRLKWSAVWARLSALSFGVYLFHPVILDSLEIAQREWEAPAGVTVSFNFVAVTLISFLVVALASRVAFLRTAFGLSSETTR